MLMHMQLPTSIPMEPVTPDVLKAGEVLATLNDWRAVLFMAGFVIVFLLIFTVWREWAMQSERKLMAGERQEMRTLAASFAESAGVVSATLSDLSTKIAVLAALTARAEASIAESQEGRHDK